VSLFDNFFERVTLGELLTAVFEWQVTNPGSNPELFQLVEYLVTGNPVTPRNFRLGYSARTTPVGEGFIFYSVSL
jgi:hypothetical protein